MKLRVAIAADHAGVALKAALRERLVSQGHEVEDLGTDNSDSCDYPDFAHHVALAIEQGRASRGVLVCGTGVGMSMAANRHPEVRAVVCSESVSAKLSRRHNDANVLCLGARVIGVETAFEVLDAFMGAEFEGGRHLRRVAKINPE